MDAFRYLCPVHGVVVEIDREDGAEPPRRCPVEDEPGRPCGQELTFVYAQSSTGDR